MRLQSRLKTTIQPAVYIQLIYTFWTKASRGGAGAVARSKVPPAIEFSDLPASVSDCCYIVQRVRHEEHSDFRPTTSLTIHSAVQPLTIDSVTLRVDHMVLHADYRWFYPEAGVPERGERSDALVLPLDAWGRIQYNARHSDSDGYWWYDQHIFNIGFFVQASPRIFLDSEPAQVYSKLDRLWYYGG